MELVIWLFVGEKRNRYEVSVGNPEGKRPLRRLRNRWEDNIKIYLKEIEWQGVNQNHLASDNHQWRTLMNMIRNFSAQQDALK
jgi:hypothetical protein